MKYLPRINLRKYQFLSKTWYNAYRQYLILNKLELSPEQVKVVDEMLSCDKRIKVIKYPVGWGKTLTALCYLLTLSKKIGKESVFPVSWTSSSKLLSIQTKNAIHGYLEEHNIKLTISDKLEDKSDIFITTSSQRKYLQIHQPSRVWDENSHTILKKIYCGNLVKFDRLIILDASYTNIYGTSYTNIYGTTIVTNIQELVYKQTDSTSHNYNISDINLEYHYFSLDDRNGINLFLEDKYYIHYINFTGINYKFKRELIVVDKDVVKIQRNLEIFEKTNKYNGIRISSVYNRGLNVPKINTIITSPNANHYQQIGRGIRRANIKDTMYIVVITPSRDIYHKNIKMLRGMSKIANDFKKLFRKITLYFHDKYTNNVYFDIAHQR